MKQIFVSSTMRGAVHPRRLRNMTVPVDVCIPAGDPYVDLIRTFCARRGWPCRVIERWVVDAIELPMCPPFTETESLRPMARGGFSLIFEAIYRDRVIVLKRIDGPAGLAHPVRYLIGAQEAKILPAIRSPWIVPVLGTGVTGTAIWIAMERMQTTLHHVLPHLSPSEVWRVLADACRGLADLHAYGWVHMDVKPQNIFLCNGRGRIGDLSSVWRRDVYLPMRIRTVTTQYADPVLTRPEHRFLRATPDLDVYAIGMILHEYATARKLSHTAAMRLANRCMGTDRPDAQHLAAMLEAMAQC